MTSWSPSSFSCRGLSTFGRPSFPVAAALSDNRVPASVQNPGSHFSQRSDCSILSSCRYRPTGSVPADAHVDHLRCRGLRLRHHGSAHRGVHGDTSRAIVSLPSHGMMVCEISSDGPPHVSQTSPADTFSSRRARSRGPICWSPRPWPTWRRSESCTSVCWCTGGTAGFAHGVVSSHELGSTAIAARACFAKGAISHFHYGAPGCSDIVES